MSNEKVAKQVQTLLRMVLETPISAPPDGPCKEFAEELLGRPVEEAYIKEGTLYATVPCPPVTFLRMTFEIGEKEMRGQNAKE